LSNLCERLVVVVTSGDTSDLGNIPHILRTHFLGGYFDRNAVELVKADLAILKSFELGFNPELSAPVMPNTSLASWRRTLAG
jgi:hypothetical protein